MKINLQQIKQSHQTPWLVVDAIMMGLISINLIWLIFDTLFTSYRLRETLAWAFPEFTRFYAEQVHPDFVFYDLIFVSIFITELLVRWGVAIHQRTYHRWFFYPFVHWYDVLGCIPVGSFRWLRLLRIFSILYRLQKYQIIDLSNTYPWRFISKYFNALVEEISDRVVINVLSGVQQEIQTGNPVAEKIVSQVLLPQKTILIDWLSERVNTLTDVLYQPKREHLRRYVRTLLSEALEKDARLAAMERMPLLGDAMVNLIEQTISDIAFNVIDQLIADVGHEDTDLLVKEMSDVAIEHLLQPSHELNVAGRAVLIDVLEVVKEEVAVKKWKLAETEL